MPGPLASVLLLAFGIIQLAAARTPAPVAQWPAALVDIGLPLWWSWRRSAPPRWSLAVYIGSSAALLAVRAQGSPAIILVLIGTVVGLMRSEDRSALAFGAASLLIALAAGVRTHLQFGVNNGIVTAVVSYAVAFGALIPRRQRLRHQWETEDLLARLADEHRRLEVAHAELAEHARHVAELSAAEERNRIAREIHDVLAHALTAIIVQAEAASVRLRTDPRAGGEQVRAVAQLAREALQDARLSVAAIRADPGVAGLQALQRLCDGATRLGGLRCACVVEGDEHPLPAAVAHAAYRIVQEALTNARRHGHAAHAEVRVALRAGELLLTVADDGTGTGQAEAVPGSGLRGMRERAEGIGGTLRAGPEAGGRGFRVEAVLPLDGRAAPGQAGPAAGAEAAGPAAGAEAAAPAGGGRVLERDGAERPAGWPALDPGTEEVRRDPRAAGR